MSSPGDTPAFAGRTIRIDENTVVMGSPGLTKRELFAAMAMQGHCANPNSIGTLAHFAMSSVKFADALLAELSKPEEASQ